MARVWFTSKPEDLSSGPLHSHKNAGMEKDACDTGSGEAETGESLELTGCILAELASSKVTENPSF